MQEMNRLLLYTLYTLSASTNISTMGKNVTEG